MRWTLPNIITVARVALLPLLLVLIWPGLENRETCFWAAVVFAAAGVLDVVDGVLARRRNEVTVLGKFLDPLADKVFYLVTLVALLQLPVPRVPGWVLMAVITREIAITGLRGIAVSEGVVIAADAGGKLKTALATVGMCGLLIHYPFVVNFGFVQAVLNPHRVGLWITYVSVLIAVASGVNYVRNFVLALRQRESL